MIGNNLLRVWFYLLPFQDDTESLGVGGPKRSGSLTDFSAKAGRRIRSCVFIGGEVWGNKL